MPTFKPVSTPRQDVRQFPRRVHRRHHHKHRIHIRCASFRRATCKQTKAAAATAAHTASFGVKDTRARRSKKLITFSQLAVKNRTEYTFPVAKHMAHRARGRGLLSSTWPRNTISSRINCIVNTIDGDDRERFVVAYVRKINSRNVIFSWNN